MKHPADNTFQGWWQEQRDFHCLGKQQAPAELGREYEKKRICNTLSSCFRTGLSYLFHRGLF
jgi:hypothetical protein